MKSKIYPNIDAAVAGIPDGSRIMFGGFGGAGFPNNLIQGLARAGTKNITAISNNCGTHDGELGLIFKNNQIRHVIAAFPAHTRFIFRNAWPPANAPSNSSPKASSANACAPPPRACWASTPR